MAKQKVLPTQLIKVPTNAPEDPTPSAGSASVSPAGIASVPPEASESEPLWERFCAEAGFSPETLELEAAQVREEIAGLEERIAEKRSELEEITHREQTARDKMSALFKVGFSADAILSAMKVEFRTKKPAGRVKEKEVEIGEEEKTAVLDVLDREGQPLSEIARHVGRDAKDVQRVLLALVAEGKVNSQGERKGKLFMRV